MDETKIFVLDPRDQDSLTRIMDELGDSPFPFSGRNDGGEETLISVFPDHIVVNTSQKNGWVRLNTYWRDGTQEETFEGRWKELTATEEETT